MASNNPFDNQDLELNNSDFPKNDPAQTGPQNFIGENLISVNENLETKPEESFQSEVLKQQRSAAEFAGRLKRMRDLSRGRGGSFYALKRSTAPNTNSTPNSTNTPSNSGNLNSTQNPNSSSNPPQTQNPNFYQPISQNTGYNWQTGSSLPQSPPPPITNITTPSQPAPETGFTTFGQNPSTDFSTSNTPPKSTQIASQTTPSTSSQNPTQNPNPSSNPPQTQNPSESLIPQESNFTPQEPTEKPVSFSLTPQQADDRLGVLKPKNPNSKNKQISPVSQDPITTTQKNPKENKFVRKPFDPLEKEEPVLKPKETKKEKPEVISFAKKPETEDPKESKKTEFGIDVSQETKDNQAVGSSKKVISTSKVSSDLNKSAISRISKILPNLVVGDLQISNKLVFEGDEVFEEIVIFDKKNGLKESFEKVLVEKLYELTYQIGRQGKTISEAIDGNKANFERIFAQLEIFEDKHKESFLAIIFAKALSKKNLGSADTVDPKKIQFLKNCSQIMQYLFDNIKKDLKAVNNPSKEFLKKSIFRQLNRVDGSTAIFRLDKQIAQDKWLNKLILAQMPLFSDLVILEASSSNTNLSDALAVTAAGAVAATAAKSLLEKPEHLDPIEKLKEFKKLEKSSQEQDIKETSAKDKTKNTGQTDKPIGVGGDHQATQKDSPDSNVSYAGDLDLLDSKNPKPKKTLLEKFLEKINGNKAAKKIAKRESEEAKKKLQGNALDNNPALEATNFAQAGGTNSEALTIGESTKQIEETSKTNLEIEQQIEKYNLEPVGQDIYEGDKQIAKTIAGTGLVEVFEKINRQKQFLSSVSREGINSNQFSEQGITSNSEANLDNYYQQVLAQNGQNNLDSTGYNQAFESLKSQFNNTYLTNPGLQNIGYRIYENSLRSQSPAQNSGISTTYSTSLPTSSFASTRNSSSSTQDRNSRNSKSNESLNSSSTSTQKLQTEIPSKKPVQANFTRSRKPNSDNLKALPDTRINQDFVEYFENRLEKLKQKNQIPNLNKSSEKLENTDQEKDLTNALAYLKADDQNTIYDNPKLRETYYNTLLDQEKEINNKKLKGEEILPEDDFDLNSLRDLIDLDSEFGVTQREEALEKEQLEFENLQKTTEENRLKNEAKQERQNHKDANAEVGYKAERYVNLPFFNKKIKLPTLPQNYDEHGEVKLGKLNRNDRKALVGKFVLANQIGNKRFEEEAVRDFAELDDLEDQVKNLQDQNKIQDLQDQNDENLNNLQNAQDLENLENQNQSANTQNLQNPNPAGQFGDRTSQAQASKAARNQAISELKSKAVKKARQIATKKAKRILAKLALKAAAAAASFLTPLIAGLLIFIMLIMLVLVVGGFAVYCIPIKPIRDPLELGFAGAAVATGDVKYVINGVVQGNLVPKSPIRLLFEKFPGCNIDAEGGVSCPAGTVAFQKIADANGNITYQKYEGLGSGSGGGGGSEGDGSKDTGVGTGNVPCLTAARSGDFGNPYLRAFIRALGQAESGGSYTISNGSGCYGRYQFCPGGSWAYVANKSDGVGGTFPSSPSSSTSEQQDLAKIIAWNEEAKFRTNGFDIKALTKVLESQGIQAALNKSNEGNPFTIGGVTRYGMCAGWTPLCSKDVDPDQGQQSLIIEAYNKVLPEEKEGKCGSKTLVNFNNSTNSDQIASQNTFNPLSFLSPIKVEAVEKYKWVSMSGAFNAVTFVQNDGKYSSGDTNSGGVDITIVKPGDPYEKSRNTPVVAHQKGTVTHIKKGETESKTGYGNQVGVYFPESGLTAIFSHMQTVDVAVGQEVQPGSLLGRQGSSGSSRGGDDGTGGGFVHIDLRLYAGKVMGDPGGVLDWRDNRYNTFTDQWLRYYDANTDKIIANNFSPTTGIASDGSGGGSDSLPSNVVCCPPNKEGGVTSAEGVSAPGIDSLSVSGQKLLDDIVSVITATEVSKPCEEGYFNPGNVEYDAITKRKVEAKFPNVKNAVIPYPKNPRFSQFATCEIGTWALKDYVNDAIGGAGPYANIKTFKDFLDKYHNPDEPGSIPQDVYLSNFEKKIPGLTRNTPISELRKKLVAYNQSPTEVNSSNLLANQTEQKSQNQTFDFSKAFKPINVEAASDPLSFINRAGAVDSSSFDGSFKRGDKDSGGVDVTFKFPGYDSVGTPIVSPYQGEVVYVKDGAKGSFNPYDPATPGYDPARGRAPGSYGNQIGVYFPELKHTVYYSHLDSVANGLKIGSTISPGSLIAIQGKTGSLISDEAITDITIVVGKGVGNGRGQSLAAWQDPVYAKWFNDSLSYYSKNEDKIKAKDYTATSGGLGGASTLSGTPDECGCVAPVGGEGSPTGNGSISPADISTADQWTALTLAILEAPSLQGQLDVLTVIANRAGNNFGGYGSNVIDQSFASGQFQPFFSGINKGDIKDRETAINALMTKSYSREAAIAALEALSAATQNPTMTAESESKIKNFVYFKGVSQYGNMQPGDFLRNDGENFFHNESKDTNSYKAFPISSLFSKKISNNFNNSETKSGFESFSDIFSIQVFAQDATTKPEAKTETKLDLSKIATQTGAQSIVIQDIQTGEIQSYNGDKSPSYGPASTIKTVIVDSVLQKVKSGQIKLDDTITIPENLRALDSDKSKALADNKGKTTWTVREAIAATLGPSSNTATNALVYKLTGTSKASDVNPILASSGYSSTRFNSFLNLQGAEPQLASSGGNTSNALEITKALSNLNSGSSAGYDFARQAMGNGALGYVGNGDDPISKGINGYVLGKAGSTSRVTGNTAIVEIEGKKYIVTTFVEKNDDSTIIQTTNQVVTELKSGSTLAPTSKSGSPTVTGKSCPVVTADMASGASNTTSENLRSPNFDGKFIIPLPTGTYTDYFAYPYNHPQRQRPHAGIDISTGGGANIKASAAGKVVLVGSLNGYGNTIIINHTGDAEAKGTETLYAHLSSISVKKGDNVTQGQNIGIEGSTGIGSGPHLHFEIRKNNIPQPPCQYIQCPEVRGTFK